MSSNPHIRMYHSGIHNDGVFRLPTRWRRHVDSGRPQPWAEAERTAERHLPPCTVLL